MVFISLINHLYFLYFYFHITVLATLSQLSNAISYTAFTKSHDYECFYILGCTFHKFPCLDKPNEDYGVPCSKLEDGQKISTEGATLK
jgi:hypothetical protein